MTATELSEILAKHAKWRRGEADGERAYLSGADLSRADLSRADLSDADLSDADLSDADLSGADLSRADLSRADLSRAYLSRADLSRADLSGANLSRAYLSDAIGYASAPESERTDPLPVPVIPRIHSTILAAVTAQGCSLDMRDWHSCETTHCRAGWAIHLTGAEGAALEKKYGPFIAGGMIYRASDPQHPAPHFFASTDRAMADIKACAEREASEA